eukprot:939763-Pelagomonas_calceolata.AAC.3
MHGTRGSAPAAQVQNNLRFNIEKANPCGTGSTLKKQPPAAQVQNNLRFNIEKTNPSQFSTQAGPGRNANWPCFNAKLIELGVARNEVT